MSLILDLGVALVTSSGLCLLLTRWQSSSSRFLPPADERNERSLHTRPTPRTGGLAIWGGVGVGALLMSIRGAGLGIARQGRTENVGATLWVWIGGGLLLLIVVSFCNDRCALPISLRLGVHGVAAAGVVLGAGVMLHAVSVPLIGTVEFGRLAAPVTIFSLMWMTNLYNFMDGMDGFAGGMTVFGFGCLSYLAWLVGRLPLASLTSLIAAAAAGFLLYNFAPAKIFMGDAGSVALGFVAGAVAIVGIDGGVFDVWVPVLVFSPFILDATATLFGRLLRGDKVWRAHRTHYYQRVVLAGWGHRKTVLAEYGLMLGCAMAALCYASASAFVRLVLLAAWGATFAALAWGVHLLECRGSDAARNRGSIAHV